MKFIKSNCKLDNELKSYIIKKIKRRQAEESAQSCSIK